MRSLRLRQGVRESRQALTEAASLAKANLSATALLGLVLALLPAMVQAALTCSSQATLISVWAGWVDALFSGGAPAEGLSSLLYVTMQQSGAATLWDSVVGLVDSLALTPLLLCALALTYNGYVRQAGRPAFYAGQMAVRNIRNILLVALCLMFAEWFVEMVPSIVSGLLSAVAGLLSFIPVLGTIANVLAVALSLLVSLLTSFAVTVLFCYVWIYASCEGETGFGALARSWRLTRGAMHETIAALLGLILLRWVAVLALCLIWATAGRALGIPLKAVVYGSYAIGACYTVFLGATTSALYQQTSGAYPNRPHHTGPDFRRMKRANID